jgi:hypothetical protein
LVGPSFAYSWDGKVVNGLMAFVQSSMPLMNPGTLDERSAVILVAYILSANGVVAGPTPLTRSASDVIVLPANGAP